MGTLAMGTAYAGVLLVVGGLGLRVWSAGHAVAAAIGGFLMAAALGLVLRSMPVPAAVPTTAPAAPTVPSAPPAHAAR